MPDDEQELPEVQPVVRARSRRAEIAAAPSLKPELLSGRSLAPPPRRRGSVWRDHRGLLALAAAVLVVVIVVVGGKILAERAADAATAERADDLAELLADATPEDFLAFNAGVTQEGSLAQQVRDTDGFVNVRANAERSFIRFQPSGWWAGFTERCVVVVVRADSVDIDVPKVACVRVAEPGA